MQLVHLPLIFSIESINMLEPITSGLALSSMVLSILSFLALSNPSPSLKGPIFFCIAIILALLSPFTQLDSVKYTWTLPTILLGMISGIVLASLTSSKYIYIQLLVFQCLSSLSTLLITRSYALSNPVMPVLNLVETTFSLCFGPISFMASLVIILKLSKIITTAPVLIFGWFRHVINSSIVVIFFTVTAFYVSGFEVHDRSWYLIEVAVLGVLFGLFVSLPIGANDISAFSSILIIYGSWCSINLGLVYQNLLIVFFTGLAQGGAFALSSSICNEINRGTLNMIAANFGSSFNRDSKVKKIKNCMTTDVVNLVKLIKKSKSIVIVPGAGMSASGANRKLKLFSNLLIEHGRKVKFCLHPIAGRFPGQIFKELSEAGIDSELIVDYKDSQLKFKETDLALVVGANDIINVDSFEDSSTNLSGIEPCKVIDAKNVVIMKRSNKGLGYSRDFNSIFSRPNVLVLYADACDSLSQILKNIEKPSKSFTKVNLTEDPFEGDIIVKTEYDDYPPPLMTIGIPQEIAPLEKRVSASPSIIPKLKHLGYHVKVESNAGKASQFSDKEYLEQGAEIVSTSAVWNSDIILKVCKIEPEEESFLSNVKLVVSEVNPSLNIKMLQRVSNKYPKLVYLAMDCVPKSNKAMKIDVNLGMASITGYRAVVEAFQEFQRCPKPMITAAGKLPAAQVLIIGAGNAGRSALSYCKSLGCIVSVIDSRISIKHDIESLGAKFLQVASKDDNPNITSAEYIKAQHSLIKEASKTADIIITSANIQRREAAQLIDQEIISGMKPGSVIVDLLANLGGNCRFTKKDQKVVTENGVIVIGYTDLLSRVAPQSSEVYSGYLANLVTELGCAGSFKVDENHEILGDMIVVKEGKVHWYMKPSVNPVSSLVLGGRLVAKLAIPLIVEKKEAFYKRYEILLVFFVIYSVFLGASLAIADDANSEWVMFAMLVIVLSNFVGFFVLRKIRYTVRGVAICLLYASNAVGVIGVVPMINDDTYFLQFMMQISSIFLMGLSIAGGCVLALKITPIHRKLKSNSENL